MRRRSHWLLGQARQLSPRSPHLCTGNPSRRINSLFQAQCRVQSTQDNTVTTITPSSNPFLIGKSWFYCVSGELVLMKPDVLEWGNLRGQSLGSSLCYRIRDAEDEMFLKNASKKVIKCSNKFRKNQLTSLRSKLGSLPNWTLEYEKLDSFLATLAHTYGLLISIQIRLEFD